MYKHYQFLSDCIEAQKSKNQKEALQAISYFGPKEDPERDIQRTILDKRDQRNLEMLDCQDILYKAFQALAREQYKDNERMLAFWGIK